MTVPVEKPPHVDPERMWHITPEALRAAVTVDDLRSHLTRRREVSPIRDPLRWAAHVRGTPRETETVAQAEELLRRAVDFTDPGHGRSGLYGFHYLYWTEPLINAYALTRDPRYATRWADIFDAWYAARERVHGGWPGLHVVWYTLGIACRSQVLIRALHTVGDALPDGTWHRLVATLLGGARWLAEEHDRFRHGNWQLAGCAVLTEIASYLPEFAEAPAWAALARRRLLEHLTLDVYADGGHYERSPTYHAMCLGGLQNAALRDRTIAAHPRLRAMHDWLLTLATPGGVVPPFNDSHLVRVAEPLLRGWHLYGDQDYLAAARRWFSEEQIAEVLAWLPPRDLPKAAPEPTPQRSVWLAESKFAVLRAGDRYAAVNCGPYIEHELESHSHHTALDLVLWGHGRPLAWEAGGPDSYDDPEYHSWYRATRAHNTIRVGDTDMAPEHDADVSMAALLPEVDVLVATHDGWRELSQARHRRTVLFLRSEPAYWVVIDELGDAEYVWQLHGLSPWQGDPETGLHNGRGPGLLVLPTGSPTAVRHTEGPTRIPDADGAPVVTTLHGLALSYPAGVSRHVLVPYPDTPPSVSVSTQDDAVHVTRSGGVDVIGDDHLVRTAEGRVTAAAAWGASRIRSGDHTLLAGAVDAASLTVADGCWTVTCDVSRRTTVWLGATGRTRLAGVEIDPITEDGGTRVSLPAAGRWEIEIEGTT